MTKKEKLDYHLLQIQSHKRAIERLGVYPKIYILPVSIPFKINYNYPITCPGCKAIRTSLVFYRSRLLCPKCAKAKWGRMELVKEWRLV